MRADPHIKRKPRAEPAPVDPLTLLSAEARLAILGKRLVAKDPVLRVLMEKVLYNCSGTHAQDPYGSPMKWQSWKEPLSRLSEYRIRNDVGAILEIMSQDFVGSRGSRGLNLGHSLLSQAIKYGKKLCYGSTKMSLRRCLKAIPIPPLDNPVAFLPEQTAEAFGKESNYGLRVVGTPLLALHGFCVASRKLWFHCMTKRLLYLRKDGEQYRIYCLGTWTFGDPKDLVYLYEA
jgi:hypothetical protein